MGDYNELRLMLEAEVKTLSEDEIQRRIVHCEKEIEPPSPNRSGKDILDDIFSSHHEYQGMALESLNVYRSELERRTG